MISFNTLNEQNHKITELTGVISYLVKDRSICDTRTCCQLFHSYINKVHEHIQLVDSNFYSDLLVHPSAEVNNTAKDFMSGSKEIKRILANYSKKWCNPKSNDLSIGNDYPVFLQETDTMFEIILNRIQDETERLYPLSRKLDMAVA